MKTRRLAVLLFAVAIPPLGAPNLAGAAGGGSVAIDAVALPGHVACSFRSERWFDEIRLELAPGIPYAEIKGVDAIEIAVPVAAAPAPAGVKVTKGKIALEGLVAASAVPLNIAHPFMIGELFLAGGGTEFHLTDAREGEVGVEVTLAASTMKVLKGVERRLRARRPCGDLSITGEVSNPFEPVGGRGLDEEARFKTGGLVPVSATAGGAPLARLIPSRSVSEAMFVLDRQPGWTRIAVTLDDLTLVGWVPAASVLPPPKTPELGSFGTRGRGSPTPGPAAMKTPFTCRRDLHLIAEARKQRRIVGTLGAGVRMEVAPGDADLAVVTVDGLKPASGARFLVRRDELDDGCARGIGSGGAGNTQGP